MISQIGRLTILGGIVLLITVKSTQSQVSKTLDVEATFAKLNERVSLQQLLIDPNTFCLAENIYHEARNEPTAGMVAVGNVTMNRVYSKRFPNSICTVVHQGPHYESWKTRNLPDLPDESRVYYPIKHRCQFSWYCDGLSDDIRNKRKFQQILELAVDIRKKIYPDITDGATHYHANYVDPSWAKVYNKTVTINTHIFYKHD
jgi:spore germination cell wall hydrolase CwlJ-like protein